jgi:hypothetical protein
MAVILLKPWRVFCKSYVHANLTSLDVWTVVKEFNMLIFLGRGANSL